jgi:hypothetical protein
VLGKFANSTSDDCATIDEGLDATAVGTIEVTVGLGATVVVVATDVVVVAKVAHPVGKEYLEAKYPLT